MRRPRSRRAMAAGIAVASVGLIVAGVALIYPPVALIVAGLALGGVLFVDVDTGSPSR